MSQIIYQFHKLKITGIILLSNRILFLNPILLSQSAEIFRKNNTLICPPKEEISLFIQPKYLPSLHSYSPSISASANQVTLSSEVKRRNCQNKSEEEKQGWQKRIIIQKISRPHPDSQFPLF